MKVLTIPWGAPRRGVGRAVHTASRMRLRRRRCVRFVGGLPATDNHLGFYSLWGFDWKLPLQTLPTCKQFQSAACDESDPTTHTPWHAVPGGDGKSGVEGKCSGDFISGSIVDHVLIPATLAPGDYVLGWRWDVSAPAPSLPSRPPS